MTSDFIKMISDWRDRRYSRVIQNLSAQKIPCGMFLAPSVPENTQGLRNFFNGKKLNLTCVCTMNEADKARWQAAEGETVVSLEEFPALKDKPQYMFLLSGFFPLMFMDYFNKFGTKMFGFNGKSAAEDRYEYYMKRLPELYDVHEMLADEESKKVFRAYIITKMTNLITDFRFAPEPQYFLEGFLPNAGDIAIDGGAYDGATAIDFAKQGAQVYAFEMNATNYQNCLTRIDGAGGDLILCLKTSA